jgi:hypothetical protein
MGDRGPGSDTWNIFLDVSEDARVNLYQSNQVLDTVFR